METTTYRCARCKVEHPIDEPRTVHQRDKDGNPVRWVCRKANVRHVSGFFKTGHGRVVKAAQNARRRTQKTQAGGFVTAEQLTWLYNAYGGRCHLCRQEVALNEVAWDHLTPVSKGGETSLTGLAPAHRSCNSERGSKGDRLDYPPFLSVLVAVLQGTAPRA